MANAISYAGNLVADVVGTAHPIGSRTVSRSAAGIVATLALVAFGLYAATPALAGISAAVGPTWTTPVNVGDGLSGYVDIFNASTGANATESVNVTGIYLTPSCQAGTNRGCTTPDPGVFSISSPIGEPGTACGGVKFKLMPPDPTTGEVALLPMSTFKLGPSDGSGAPPYCSIAISSTALRLPLDSTPSTAVLTTNLYARAVLVGAISGASGAGSGTALVAFNTAGTASLTATPGNSQNSLSWSAALGSGVVGSPSFTYKLVYSTAGPVTACYAGTPLLTGSTATSFVHAGLVNGTTYYYRLCATDDVNYVSATATTNAAPQGPVNQPPVAGFSVSPTAQPLSLTTVSFDGSASSDPDGTIASWTWDFGDAVTATGKLATHAYLKSGTYTAKLTVTDALGASASTTRTITVGNRPPVANAGADQTVLSLTPVSFNGSGSSDPDGTIASYAWTFGDATSGTGANPTHAYATPGTYTATLTVTDNSGATASNTMKVTVTNRAPVADPGADRSVLSLVQATYSGAASSDPDGTIASYAWTFGDGGTAAGASVTHTYAKPGTYTLTLTVTDNSGATNSKSITVTVTNRPPVADPGADRTVQSLVQATYSGAASSDADGTIASYAWTFGDGGTAAGVSATHTYAKAGTYTLTLTVTDNSGATGSKSITVTVSNRAPVADAGADQVAQSLVSLNFSGANSSDPDGTIATYAWTFGDGTTGSGVSASHAYAKPGAYTVTLTVTDNSGATASDTAAVTITNRLPVANAGPDQTTVVGTAITLNGAGSSDPDGTIATYLWNFGDGSPQSSGSASSTTHAYAGVGTYTVTLTVTDNSGGQAVDTAIVTVKAAASGPGSLAWVDQHGGTNGLVSTASAATDAQGNVVVTGMFYNTVDFGSGPLTSVGASDIFVAKYAADGTPLWSRAYGGLIDDYGNGVAFDASGNVIVVGSFKLGVDFGCGAMAASGSIGTSDAFVTKLDKDGNCVWSKRYGGSPEDSAAGVAIDGSGNIVVVGTFEGRGTYGSVVLPNNGASPDVFLLKLSSAGVQQWVKSYGGTGLDYGNAVAVDSTGNIFMTGSFMGPASFGGATLNGIGGSDIMLAKYDPNGTNLWTLQIGGDVDDEALGLTVGPDGNPVITGYVQNTVDFGGGNTSSLGGWDTFVAKYSSATGAHLWSRRLGGLNTDQGLGITTDANSNVLLVGTFQGTANFGGASLVSSGGYDIVAAKFSASGTPLWSKQFGGATDDIGSAVAVDASGNPTFVGAFSGTVNFGDGPMTAVGSRDMFVLRLLP